MRFTPQILKMTIAFWGIVLAVLHLSAALTGSGLLWGVDSWSWFPHPWPFILAAAVLVLVVPVSSGLVSRVVLVPAGKISGLFRGRKFYLAAAAGAAAAGVLFWSLRCRVYLLGDGYWWIRNVEGGIRFHLNEPLALYLTWLARDFGGRLAGISTEGAFRFISIAGGVVSVYLLFLLARLMGRRSGAGPLIFLGLLTLGTTQLFLGYVETYPLVIAAVILYIFLGIRQLESNGSVFWPAVAFLLCLLMHLTAASLAPSLAWLYRHWWKNPGKSSKPGSLVLVLAGPLLVVTIFLLSIGMTPALFLGSSEGGTLPFFPFVQAGSVYFSYGLFSLPHLSDLLNLALLISPFCIPLWLLPVVYKDRLGPREGFLVLASLFPLGALVMFNPELGFPRDWDVFAFSLIAPTLLGITMLVKVSGNQKGLLGYAGTVIIGTSLLHLVPWVLVQADEGRSLERYEHLLAAGTARSAHARAFGHEDVTNYYRGKERYDIAAAHYRKAIEATPGTSRLYLNLAAMYQREEQLDQAIAVMEKAAVMFPEELEVKIRLGSFYRDAERFREAADQYAGAVRLKPDLYGGWFNLGTMLIKTGDYREAVGPLQKAVELCPDSVSAHLNLGSSFAFTGVIDRAIQEYRTALKLDPDNEIARHNLGYLQREYLEDKP
ncbi:MAG: tetratricopeptide repeat protein [Candidatus Glassbacteria bacterium]|nr:tetratricopeptide repeat protein [Candidatus Glassbacteria bacterium]